jgi:hypothetical protein
MGTRSSFVGRTPVHITIDDDKDRYIAIKPKLGQGDRLKLIDRLMEIQALANATDRTTGTKITVIARWGAFVDELMAMSIVGWALTGEDGKPMPFDPGMIAELDPDDPLVVKAQEECVSRNPLGALRMTGATT